MEQAITTIMDDLEHKGGMVRCLEEGIVQRRIAERAFEYQRDLDSGKVPVVGVNVFKAQEGGADPDPPRSTRPPSAPRPRRSESCAPAATRRRRRARSTRSKRRRAAPAT